MATRVAKNVLRTRVRTAGASGPDGENPTRTGESVRTEDWFFTASEPSRELQRRG